MTGYRQKLGQAGEDYAVDYLRKNGYSIVATNFRTKCGEIDIIARENGYLVFVEVKTRTNRAFGGGLHAVAMPKKHHLVKAALIYIMRFGLHHENCRFDLLSLDVMPNGDIVGQNLIKNAFSVDGRYRF